MEIDTILGSALGTGSVGSLMLYFIKRSLSRLDDNTHRINEADKYLAVQAEKVATLRKDINNAHAKIREIEKFNNNY